MNAIMELLSTTPVGLLRDCYHNIFAGCICSSSKICCNLFGAVPMEKLPQCKSSSFRHTKVKLKCSVTVNGGSDSFSGDTELGPSLVLQASELADARVIYCAAPAMGHNQESHPECNSRVPAILDTLQKMELTPEFRGKEVIRFQNFRSASVYDIAAVHSSAYVMGLEKAMETAAQEGLIHIEGSGPTYATSTTFSESMLAAGAGITITDLVNGSYPGTGKMEEVGKGPGEGTTLNLPLPGGSGDQAMSAVFEEVIVRVAQRFKPDIIMVSAGYDAHVLDPLANLQFTTNTYYKLALFIKQLAREHCGGRCVFFLEGGYDLRSLSYSVADTFRAFLGEASISSKIDNPAVLYDEPLLLVDKAIAKIKAIHAL